MVKSSLTKFLAIIIISLFLIAIGRADDNQTEVQKITASRQALTQARQAYKEKNFKLYLESMQQAQKLRPNHPTILYNLAGAYALNGNNKEALTQLTIIAEMGLIYPTNDADFNSIKDTNEYKELGKKFEANRNQINHSQTAFTLAEKGLVTEGLAYDDKTETFFISSVHRRKIVSVNKQGEVKDFATAANGLWSVLGMRVDSKRRHLWVCTTAFPQMVDYKPEDKGKSAILKFDLTTGKLIKSYPLTDPSPQGHNVGDLIIDSHGNVYSTDSTTPILYRISKDRDQLEKVLAGGPFVSPQGLAFSEDEKTLFIADYSTGLFAVDPANGKVTQLKHADNICLLGIDGLYYHKGHLIAIQNGVNPHRVMRLKLHKDHHQIAQAEVIEANNPLFNEPTLGVIAGDNFYYIANSQWETVDENGKLAAEEKLKNPVIMKFKL